MDRAVQLLDTAIGAIKTARDDLRHDTDLLPSDLSAVAGTLRELAWTIDGFISTLNDAYALQHDLGHDNGCDPAETVARINTNLEQVQRQFGSIDSILGHTHNITSKLFRRD